MVEIVTESNLCQSYRGKTVVSANVIGNNFGFVLVGMVLTTQLPTCFDVRKC